VKNDITRRAFVEKIGAYTAGGAALSLLNARASEQADSPWAPPRKYKNPNILVIMVDQMRWPVWLNSSQMTLLEQKVLPNIFGKLRKRSYVFQQYYTAATVCTAARGTLLTGLYAPQTALYIGAGDSPGSTPDLNPAFPTWGSALPAMNSAYQGNLWWFGKWHVSNCVGSTPLAPYSFNTRTYPGGAAGNPSPDGSPNEGSNGGVFPGSNVTFASDAEIAGDFIAWLQTEAPTSAPWCATVSLVNPHDIVSAPGWTVPPVPPPNLPLKPVYFQPPDFSSLGIPPVYKTRPAPWNYENLNTVTDKPGVQYAFWKKQNASLGAVSNWVEFLNQYMWFQGLVDQQIGNVLNALESSPYLHNTIVVFLADHGEFGGSHGLHDKGYAVYEEAIQVPLYVHFPGQNTRIPMNQMCSSVDFFGFLCDLVTKGTGPWRHSYPDLAERQSLWDFIYGNSPETRISPTLGVPYVFHTCDRGASDPKYHIVCLRTKTDPANVLQPGAKLGVYSAWGPCTTIPNSTPPDMEFYDYNPATSNNTREMGNDISSMNPATIATIAAYEAALGTWGPPATGLIGSELWAPLVGTGTDGNPLSQAQAAAQQAYVNHINPACVG